MVAYNVGVLCGEQNVDLWKKKEWDDVLDQSEIIVATAQVILDAIERSFIRKEQINVLVFDECHHGRLDHPYHRIMLTFDRASIGNTRIIGLSGMLIGNDSKIKPELVGSQLIKLESTFQSTM